jgi:SAM-dependent methyltransferase
LYITLLILQYNVANHTKINLSLLRAPKKGVAIWSCNILDRHGGAARSDDKESFILIWLTIIKDILDMTDFRDFSKASETYAIRPSYPKDIIQASCNPEAQNATILEIGCGTGGITKILADLFPNHRIIAIDDSKAMLSQAKIICENTHVAFYKGSSDDLPEISEKTVDVIVGGLVAHLLPQQSTIREWNRILKPTGKIILLSHLPDPEHRNTQLLHALLNQNLSSYRQAKYPIIRQNPGKALGNLAARFLWTTDLLTENTPFVFSNADSRKDFLMSFPFIANTPSNETGLNEVVKYLFGQGQALSLPYLTQAHVGVLKSHPLTHPLTMWNAGVLNNVSTR